MTISAEQRNFLRLIQRSLKGREWANVSNVLWAYSSEMAKSIPELVEIDEKHSRIKLTEKGLTILEYM